MLSLYYLRLSSIADQREVLSLEIGRLMHRAASWAQFLLNRDLSCSELILRDASGLSQDGFRFSWSVFDMDNDRPENLPVDFRLMQIEREVAGRGLIIQDALKKVRSSTENHSAGTGYSEQICAMRPSIMFWMNPRGVVRLSDDDCDQSALTRIRVFLNAVEEIVSCAAPTVTYWHEYDGGRYPRSAIPIAAKTIESDMPGLDEVTQSIVSIVRSLILLKTPKITERIVSSVLWVSGKMSPDDDPIVEFYSTDISQGEGKQVPFPKVAGREEETPEVGVTFISDDEDMVNHYKRLLQAQEVHFVGSLRVGEKKVLCKCSFAGPPLYEFLSSVPRLHDPRMGKSSWAISFGELSFSSEDFSEQAPDKENSLRILRALAALIPTGFSCSKISFQSGRRLRFDNEMTEYFPGILMRPEL